MRLSLHLVILMVAVTTAGCAAPSRGPDPGTRSASDEAFSFEARSALPSGSSGHFQTGLSAELDTPVMDYQSEYSIATGTLVKSMADTSETFSSMPMEVGRQMVRQAIRMDFPTGLDAPVRMDLDWKHDRRLRLDGEKRSESARAHLSWQPAPLLLEFEWASPRRFGAASNPLDCVADGHLRMPLPVTPGGNPVAMDISRRDCLIRAPARGLNGVPMRAHGLSVFLDQELQNFFRLQQLATDVSYPLEYQDRSAVEIGLTRNQSWHGWDMKADVAWRQASLPVVIRGVDQREWWSVDLMLSRQVELVALTARWMRARDPLWFVPTAAPIGTNRLSMLLDFSAWLAAFVPRLKPSMSASWERRQNADGVDDDRIRWDFSIHW